MTGTSVIRLFHGEALFRSGQQATHFYLVTRGSIAVAVSYTHLTLPTTPYV